MNTNLPLVPRTSDGPTWSNGWAATSTHLDLIAKQYKKGTRTGKGRGKNGIGTGSRTGFKREKMGFKQYKSPNLAKFENLEWRRTAVLRCSTSFQPVFWPFRLFSPFFHDFGQKREKRVPKNGGTGKERMHFFPVPFPFPFFTFPCLAHLYRQVWGVRPTGSPRLPTSGLDHLFANT